MHTRFTPEFSDAGWHVEGVRVLAAGREEPRRGHLPTRGLRPEPSCASVERQVA